MLLTHNIFNKFSHRQLRSLTYGNYFYLILNLEGLLFLLDSEIYNVIQWREAVAQTCSGKKVFLAWPGALLKKRLWQRCFAVNFAKFLTTPFLTEHLWWLFLNGYCILAVLLFAAWLHGKVLFLWNLVSLKNLQVWDLISY